MPHLQTDRLTIIPFTLDLVQATMRDKRELEALLGVRVPDEWPGPDFAEILPWKAQILSHDPSHAAWGGLIIHTVDRTIIGDMGLKGGPDDTGTAEVGYSIIPAYRRQGYASEAVRALIQWAFRQPGVERITAECLEKNVGSIRVLESLGMRQRPPEHGMVRWELHKESTG